MTNNSAELLNQKVANGQNVLLFSCSFSCRTIMAVSNEKIHMKQAENAVENTFSWTLYACLQWTAWLLIAECDHKMVAPLLHVIALLPLQTTPSSWPLISSYSASFCCTVALEVTLCQMFSYQCHNCKTNWFKCIWIRRRRRCGVIKKGVISFL